MPHTASSAQPVHLIVRTCSNKNGYVTLVCEKELSTRMPLISLLTPQGCVWTTTTADGASRRGKELRRYA